MVIAIVVIVSGLTLSVGGCLNKIIRLEAAIQQVEAQNRELRRKNEKMKPNYERKKEFKENFNLIVS